METRRNSIIIIAMVATSRIYIFLMSIGLMTGLCGNAICERVSGDGSTFYILFEPLEIII